MELAKETVGELYTGHVNVGTTAVRLTAFNYPLNKGVLIRTPGSADPTPNTACIWVGNPGVTADSNAGTGGMPVPPGEAVFLPIDNPNKLYVISDDADQDVAWMAM